MKTKAEIIKEFGIGFVWNFLYWKRKKFKP